MTQMQSTLCSVISSNFTFFFFIVTFALISKYMCMYLYAACGL